MELNEIRFSITRQKNPKANPVAVWNATNSAINGITYKSLQYLIYQGLCFSNDGIYLGVAGFVYVTFLSNLSRTRWLPQSV
jgi:hypothetical protein